MPAKYASHFKSNITPQSESMRSDQVKNDAGGFVWAVDDWMRLDRFCTLGCEGGTFYSSEQKLTRENAKVIVELIKKDGVRVVKRAAEISKEGRAYKNDAALFVLALAMSEGDAETKAAVEAHFNDVVRIGTHLFTFLEYKSRGWGRSLKRTVGNWYQSKEPDALAYQLVKYQQRNGWSHRDVLRLAKPVPTDEEHWSLYRYVVGKLGEEDQSFILPNMIRAREAIKNASAFEIIRFIKDYNLPREVIPTEMLTKPEIWEALLEKMPMTAMIRNLATLTRVGVLKPMGKWTSTVKERITDQEILRKARIHPLQILAALLIYSSGRGARGSNTWEPLSAITDALDKAFYLSFQNVEPTRKRTLLALDVSGSMSCGVVGGIPNLTPRIASAALALVTAATEPNYGICAFSSGMIPLAISPRQRLDDVIGIISNLPFDGTDCAQPILWALKNNLSVDTFVILTDNETWAGNIHPKQALDQYRRKTGIPAKLVTVALTSSNFTIADPSDLGMLDVVGFSTDTPLVISEFSAH